MTADPVDPVDPCEPCGPVPIAASIAALLRSLPPPTDPDALAAWLMCKADLFDQIATATADPALAADARAVALTARTTAATLAGPALTAVTNVPVSTGGAA